MSVKVKSERMHCPLYYFPNIFIGIFLLFSLFSPTLHAQTATATTTTTTTTTTQPIQLEEVVVTAKELPAPTSTSLIDRKAMRHLQPSSFADLVSLLPGQRVTTPSLNYANTLTLRQTGTPMSGYSISSLGVGFNIDGVPLDVNSNMQSTVGSGMIITPQSGYANDKRNTTRSGVDMRTIATDDIETVEVIRGIPSVKFGDISSGVVTIHRKKGYTPLRARAKADGFSKLFYIGKGLSFFENSLKLNFSLDYLNAQPDPRNSFENYKRYTASARAEKRFDTENPLTWNFSIDYTGTIDKEKRDPDVSFDRYDAYQSTYNNIRIANGLNWEFPKTFFKTLALKTSYSQSFDRIEQDKWVQITNARPVFTNTEAGEFYGAFSDPHYVSHLLIDGKPLHLYADLSTASHKLFSGYRNELLIGLTYNYNKNNGLGQVYDLAHPPSPEMDTRPRTFKSIPAMQDMAFYVEEQLEKTFWHTEFLVRAGLRANTLLGLDSRYALHNKVCFDPRVNVKVTFPKIEFANQKALSISITAGWGKHSKLPTQEMLYPQDKYEDFVQLNYYHNQKAYRQLHYKTYIFPQVNYDIMPAVNNKAEVRLGLEYNHHSLFITYFDERMQSGFRKMSDYHKVFYKKYDATGLSHNAITAPPLVENLPYTVQNALILSTMESNGSAIDKQGVEFQYSSKRLQLLNTRFTLSGAWFHSLYYNSLPVYRPSDKDVINNRRHYNLGVYPEVEKYDREQLETSLIADTYLPELKLTTSVRCDLTWYTINTNPSLSRVPTHYISEDGVRHPYTAVEANDPVLQWLIRPTTISLSDRTPLSMNIHLKISKEFYKYFTLSMYVNNLFNFYEDYRVNNQYINRRGLINPYFGMEMNVSLK